MLQWMFFEQYVHEPSIAVARFIRAFLKRHDDARLPDLLKRGNRALGIMEQHLANRSWFAGDQLSLADLALYAYTHKADDGGFDLNAYPVVRAWLARCQTERGITVMPYALEGTSLVRCPLQQSMCTLARGNRLANRRLSCGHAANCPPRN